MSLTHTDIDDDELETGKGLGGHETSTVAVAEALREYNQRRSRTAAFEHYFELAKDWDIEGAEAAHAADKRAYQQ